MSGTAAMFSSFHSSLLKGLPVKKFDVPESLNYLITNYDDPVDETFITESLELFQEVSQADFKSSTLSNIRCLLIGTKLLSHFIKINSCGPMDNVSDPAVDNAVLNSNFENIDYSSLNLDGYEISEHTKMPHYIFISEKFFKKCYNSEDEIPEKFVYGWWWVRTLFIHQKLLDGRSVSLSNEIGSVISFINDRIHCFQTDSDLKTLWFCELCNVRLYYYDIVSAKQCLEYAEKSCGAQFFMTGKLGKRTKYQTNALSQLVVEANISDVTENEDNIYYLKEFLENSHLKNVSLDDDTRLEKICIDDGSPVKSLLMIQQVVLLTELNFLRKSQPHDELVKESTIAYTEALLERPMLWSVFLVSLFQRSIVETEHSRTVERSMRQFENFQKAILSDQPSFQARYQFYFASNTPFHWEFEVALADVLVSLGLIKSALDIYKSLNLWENVIACYNHLDLKHKAEELIRNKIEENGESPKLLVYLGDATNDISFYEKAWDLSNHRNFLSQERLGLFWFMKNEFEKAIPHYQKAVELNPLEHPVWVRLAYAALQCEKWEISSRAYIHANNLDDENFENWNNLAKANLKMGNKDMALRALKQATKCNYEVWKVWENLMVVALQCYDLEWCILAYNRLLDLKSVFVDEPVLRLLVQLACDDKWDEQGDKSKRCQNAVRKLLGRLSSKVTTNSAVWESYSSLLYNCLPKDNLDFKESEDDEWHKILTYQQKAMRCHLQNRNWDKALDTTLIVINALEQLCSRTGEYLKLRPDSPQAKTFKVQCEFLYRQVHGSVEAKRKLALDPSVYDDAMQKLNGANHHLL